MEQHATRTAPKCVGCKHYWIGACSHPLTPISVVTGQSINTALFIREDYKKCGEGGKWWEAKEPTPETKRKWWQLWR